MKTRVAIAACVVAVSGCGGHTGFRAQAGDSCDHYRTQLHALPAAERDGPRGLALLRAEFDDLRVLQAPQAQARAYGRWLASGDELVRLLERQAIVLDRDNALVQAALKREKVGNRKPTPEELKHPTEAILSRTLEPLPEWHAFVRHQRAILRRANVVGRRLARLGVRLGLQDCLRGA